MKFVNNISSGKSAILDKFPEFRNSSFLADNSGWDNFAIYVDNKYLFRFPRQEDSLKQVKREIEVLNNIESKLPDNIKVPHYLSFETNRDYPFVYYKMIQGNPLTAELYKNLNKSTKENLAQYLAKFLNILHDAPINNCPSLEVVQAKSNYQDLYRQVQEICFNYLNQQEKAKTERLFSNYFEQSKLQHYTPTIVHGDLSGNHILLTDNGIGIIDFGDTSIFDPAIDLSWFYLLDKNLFYDVLSKYSAHKDPDFEQRIKQFYVPIIPYYGIIYGTEANSPKLIHEELNDLKCNLSQL